MEKARQEAFAWLGRGVLGGLVLAALAGCGPLEVKSDPTTCNVAPDAGSQLRGPQSITLINSYKAETQVKIQEGARDWMADLQQYTETAITLLNGEMAKKGISNSPQAAKSVTLRIFNVHANPGWTIRASLALEAQYGDGTKSAIVTDNSSPANAWRAVDGAIMIAVSRLLSDEKFLAYVNR